MKCARRCESPTTSQFEDFVISHSQNVSAADIISALELAALRLADGDATPFEKLLDERSVEFFEGILRPLTIESLKRKLGTINREARFLRVKNAFTWVSPRVLVVDLDFQGGPRPQSWSIVIETIGERSVVRHLHSATATDILALGRSGKGWGS